MNEITEPCAVCGRERPLAELARHLNPAEEVATLYCLDNPRCVALAKTRPLVIAAMRRHVENQFFVGVADDTVVFIHPVPMKLSRERALNLAAWIAVLADPDGGELQALINAIKRS